MYERILYWRESYKTLLVQLSLIVLRIVGVEVTGSCVERKKRNSRMLAIGYIGAVQV